MVRSLPTVAALGFLGYSSALIARRDLEESHLFPKSIPDRVTVLYYVHKAAIHPGDASMMSDACSHVSWKASMDIRKDWMFTDVVPNVIVRGLKEHKDDQEMFWQCSSAVGYMALKHPQLSKKLGQLHAVELFLDGLRTWPDNGRMQNGDIASFLIGSSKENAATWITGGGYQLTKKSMERHWLHQMVVQSGMRVIAAALKVDAKPWLENDENLGLLVKALTDHIDSYRVPESVFEVVNSLGDNQTALDKLVSKGYVQALTKAMKADAGNIFMESPGCKNLGLMAKSKAGLMRVEEEGGIEVALAVIKGFNQNRKEAKAAAEEALDFQHHLYVAEYRADVDCIHSMLAYSSDPTGAQLMAKYNVTAALAEARTRHAFEGEVEADLEQIKQNMKVALEAAAATTTTPEPGYSS